MAFSGLKQIASQFRAHLWRTALRGRLLGYSATKRFRFEQGLERSDGVVVIPPGSPGSLGDEAILNGFVELLRQSGMEELTMASNVRGDRWDHVQGIKDQLLLDEYFCRWSFREALSFGAEARRHRRVYVLGTDVIDGVYSPTRSVRRIELLRIAACFGASPILVGCSFNEAAPSCVVRSLRELPASVHICARDPISWATMCQLLDREVHLVADPAFILVPDNCAQNVQSACQWVEKEHRCGRVVVGINASYHLLLQSSSVAKEALVKVFAETITRLHHEEPALSFCLIPHDTRGDINDAVLASAICDGLPDVVRQNCLVLQSPMTAAQVKAFVAHLDCVFSGRMHLAIACLGQEIPVGCVTYQGKKFHGLFKHFELERVVVDPKDGFSSEKFVPFIRSLIARRHALREQVRKHLPRVRALAERNVDPMSK